MVAPEDLLRRAGVALAQAGLQPRLVAEIEVEIGRVTPPEPRDAPEQVLQRHADLMRQVAAVLEREGRPMSSKDIAAHVWPDVNPWRVRGWIGNFVGRDWLTSLSGPKGYYPRRYVLGTRNEWRAICDGRR